LRAEAQGNNRATRHARNLARADIVAAQKTDFLPISSSEKFV
jgi:hypothetical protein